MLSSSDNKFSSYKSFLERVASFKELGSLPVPLPHLVDDFSVQNLVDNEAKWHKSCRTKFNLNRLERAKKRLSSSTEPDAACSSEFDATGSIPKRPRRQALDKSKCIFCKQSTGKLHQFCMLEASKNVRHIATDLQNSSLLGRIEGGDLIAIEAKYHLSCLAHLQNQHRSHLRETQASSKPHLDTQLEARAQQTHG